MPNRTTAFDIPMCREEITISTWSKQKEKVKKVNFMLCYFKFI